MKKILITSLMLLAMAGVASAQEKIKDGSAGSTDAAHEPSAVLELESTEKGFLPPRLTTTERDAVTSWPEGSLIYNTTTSTVEFYNGTAWVGFSTAESKKHSTSRLSNSRTA